VTNEGSNKNLVLFVRNSSLFLVGLQDTRIVGVSLLVSSGGKFRGYSDEDDIPAIQVVTYPMG
jgi:hypothetical protein